MGGASAASLFCSLRILIRYTFAVTEPPKSLEIESESKMKVGKRVGPFHIGDAPRFTCIVQGGINSMLNSL